MLLFFIVVVIPRHNLGNSQVSVNRTIGPTLVLSYLSKIASFCRPRRALSNIDAIYILNLSIFLTNTVWNIRLFSFGSFEFS